MVICGVSDKNMKELRKMLEVYESCQWIDVDVSRIVRLVRLEEKYKNKQME